MEKTIWVLVLGVLLQAPAFGQMKLGLKGGLNLSTLLMRNESGNCSVDLFDSRVGHYFGVALELPMGRFLAFQGEALYSVKGAEGDPSTISERLTYLNFPILLKIMPIRNVYLNGGVELGYRIQREGPVVPLAENREDLAYVLGLSVELGTHFGVDLRYIGGLTDLGSVFCTDASGQTIGEGHLRNRVFQLGVHYFL